MFRSFGVQGETGDVYERKASGLVEEFVFIPSFRSLPREAVCCTVAVTGFPWRCSGVDGFTLFAPITVFSSTSFRSTLIGDTSSEVRGVSWSLVPRGGSQMDCLDIEEASGLLLSGVKMAVVERILV